MLLGISGEIMKFIAWGSSDPKVQLLPFNEQTGTIPLSITASARTRLSGFQHNQVLGELSRYDGKQYSRVVVNGYDGKVYGWNGAQWLSPEWGQIPAEPPNPAPAWRILQRIELEGFLYHEADFHLLQKRLRAQGRTEIQVSALSVRWMLRSYIERILDDKNSRVADYLSSRGAVDRELQILVLEMSQLAISFKTDFENLTQSQERGSVLALDQLQTWIDVLNRSTEEGYKTWPRKDGNYPDVFSFLAQNAGLGHLTEMRVENGGWAAPMPAFEKYAKQNARQPYWKTISGFIGSQI